MPQNAEDFFHARESINLKDDLSIENILVRFDEQYMRFYGNANFLHVQNFTTVQINGVLGNYGIDFRITSGLADSHCDLQFFVQIENLGAAAQPELSLYFTLSDGSTMKKSVTLSPTLGTNQGRGLRFLVAVRP